MILKKKKKKLDQEKVIEELLKRRSLGKDLENSYMYKHPYLADALSIGAAPAVVNKLIADSNGNTSAYDRAEENDAILSNAAKKTVRDALIGGLVGGGLGALAGAGAGAAFGSPNHQLESVMSGAGSFGSIGLGIGASLGGLYGGLSGAFRGREIARKRRENQRQLIKDALQIAKNRNFSEENTIDLIQTINENPVAASSIIGGLAGGTLGAGTSLLMGDKKKSKTRRLLEGLAIGGLGGAGLGALGGHVAGTEGMKKATYKLEEVLKLLKQKGQNSEKTTASDVNPYADSDEVEKILKEIGYPQHSVDVEYLGKGFKGLQDRAGTVPFGKPDHVLFNG